MRFKAKAYLHVLGGRQDERTGNVNLLAAFKKAQMLVRPRGIRHQRRCIRMAVDAVSETRQHNYTKSQSRPSISQYQLPHVAIDVHSSQAVFAYLHERCGTIACKA